MFDKKNIMSLLSKALMINKYYYDERQFLDDKNKNQIHIFLNDNIRVNDDIVSIITNADMVFSHIILEICNNKKIFINENESKRNFISIETKYIKEKNVYTIGYYLVETDQKDKYELYEYTGTKYLIKIYESLNAGVFDDILKININKFKNLNLLK